MINPASEEYLNRHRMLPKLMQWTLGATVDMGFLHLICFWFYVHLSLIFSAYYHWWICLLVWMLSVFFIYMYFFPFSLFVSVYVYVSLCDIVCIGLLLPLVLGFCLYGVFFSIVFSTCCHWCHFL